MARERAPIFPFTPNLLHWNLEDPGDAKGTAEQNKEAFVRVRDEIRGQVEAFIGLYSEDHQERSKAATG